MTRSLWRGWLILMVLSLLAVPLSIQYVDRPLADFVNAHITGSGASRGAMFAFSALSSC